MNRIFRNKNLIVAIVVMATLLVAVQWRMIDPNVLKTARNITFDSYQRLKPRTPVPTPVRIVDIDDASLKIFGQWPWPRTRIAKLIEQLSDMGAAAIAFDVVFAEPDRTTGSELIRQLDEIDWPDREKLRPVLDNLPDNDRILTYSIGRAPVVLGFFSLPPSPDPKTNSMPISKGKYAFAGGDPKPLLTELVNSIMPLNMLQESAAGIGLANPSPGRTDDIVRSVPIYVQDGKSIYPALSAETLRVAQGATTLIIKTTSASGEIDVGSSAVTETKIGQFSFPLTESGQFNVYYAPAQPERVLSAHEVINANNDNTKQLIEGNIVLVGTSAVGLEDLRISTLGDTIPGVSIHAQVIDQILTSEFLSRPDWAKGAEIALAIVICILILAILPFVGALVSAAVGGVMAAVIIATSWYAFSQHGVLIDPVFPTMVALAIFLITTILRFAVTEREKRFVRSAFRHYLAPDLLDKLEHSPDSLKLGGEIRDMTLMFMDIRGFTPISEKLSPEELVTFLNKLLSPLSDIILKHEGAIDKYIGDCIMAFWNAPLDVTDHRRKAAFAALEMLECINELNTADAFQFKSGNLDLSNVEIGIGLNSGDGCVGNLGSTSRFDYSVVGDTVNVAARIESSCKKFGWPLLLSEQTAASCNDFATLKAGMVALKGKSKPVALYALIGDEKFANSDYFTKLNALHDDLIHDLEKIHWKNGGVRIAAKIKKCRLHAKPDLEVFYRNIESDCC